jgi:hypothetical protein
MCNETEGISRHIFYDKHNKTPFEIQIPRLKKKQFHAQNIFSIFLQTPLHVSGVSIAHHQEVHHRDTKICFTQPRRQII